MGCTSIDISKKCDCQSLNPYIFSLSFSFFNGAGTKLKLTSFFAERSFSATMQYRICSHYMAIWQMRHFSVGCVMVVLFFVSCIFSSILLLTSIEVSVSYFSVSCWGALLKRAFKRLVSQLFPKYIPTSSILPFTAKE